MKQLLLAISMLLANMFLSTAVSYAGQVIFMLEPEVQQ